MFNPTSRVENENGQVETEWKEGSKVLFLDGSGSGMVSTIAKSDPPEHMSLKHIGVIKEGQEITKGEEVKKWAPAFENYTLKENGTKTQLLVEMDVAEEWKEYFMEAWPKALAKIKELVE